MDRIHIETHDGSTGFRPGELIAATVSWELAEPPDSLEVSLFWYTEGKGDRDVGIAATLLFEHPGPSGIRNFQMRLPAGPYSFSGKLISLVWALEAVAEPGARAGRLPITVSPWGREILLDSPAPPSYP
jgi:hypothetical protein